MGSQYKRDAERFLRDPGERLTEFGLSLHPDQTRLAEFGRFAEENRKKRGQGRPEIFYFLGLTHFCKETRSGRFRLGRKPMAKRVRRTLERIGEVLRKRWNVDIWSVGRWLGRVFTGWLNYYVVPGAWSDIENFVWLLKKRWMEALRRRSQRARFSWPRLG